MAAVQVRTAKDAAEALARAIFGPGKVFGEISIRVSEGRVTLIRHGLTLTPEDLDQLPIEKS